MEYHTDFVRSEMCFAGGSSNGRTGAFEALNLGSIPSPTAIIKMKTSFPLDRKGGQYGVAVDPKYGFRLLEGRATMRRFLKPVSSFRNLQEKHPLLYMTMRNWLDA